MLWNNCGRNFSRYCLLLMIAIYHKIATYCISLPTRDCLPCWSTWGKLHHIPEELEIALHTFKTRNILFSYSRALFPNIYVSSSLGDVRYYTIYSSILLRFDLRDYIVSGGMSVITKSNKWREMQYIILKQQIGA